jgi:hypothetical protein
VTAVTEALDVARSYHEAWTSAHFEDASAFLADELQIEVPLNGYETKADFLEAVRAFTRLIDSIEVLAMLGDCDQAVLLYDLMVEPIGPLRVAEHFTVENGVITRIRQVHDTAALREAGFERSDA